MEKQLIVRDDAIVEKPSSAPAAANPPWLGFDISAYPGNSAMQTWWSSSPYYFVGFYLAPAPHHGNTSWMSRYNTLIGQGWGLVPIYVGRQAGDGSLLTAAQGR